jgi:PadR family transcriptional regulator PadR
VLTELSLHVLLAVGEGAAHGYAIGRDIEERSGGRLDPTTGALYQALKRLTRDGLVRAVPPPKGADVDARRKYFALTAAGRREVAAEVRRLDALVALARERRLYGARA